MDSLSVRKVREETRQALFFFNLCLGSKAGIGSPDIEVGGALFVMDDMTSGIST
jgi:hypothetical protein